MALFRPRVFDRLRFIDHNPLPVEAVQQLAVALHQAVTGEHQIHIFEFFFQGGRRGRTAWAVVLFHRQLGGEGFRLPSPIREHRGWGHQQHRAFEFVLGFEVLQEGQQLDGLAQAHVVRQAGALIEAM